MARPSTISATAELAQAIGWGRVPSPTAIEGTQGGSWPGVREADEHTLDSGLALAGFDDLDKDRAVSAPTRAMDRVRGRVVGATTLDLVFTANCLEEGLASSSRLGSFLDFWSINRSLT